jgi:hypothetical protein
MSSPSGSTASDDKVLEGSKEEVDGAFHISEMWSPEREPQQEHLGGPHGEGRRHCLHLHCTLGGQSFRRHGHPGETEARPSKGEREEDRFHGGYCSFIVSPSWAAAG